MKKSHKTILMFSLKWGLVICLITFCFTNLIGVYRQEGNTMNPAVKDGDAVIYLRRPPFTSGSVILYRDRVTGTRRLSRIVAVTGNTVYMTEEGELVSNGRQAEGICQRTEPDADSSVSYPLRLEEGEVFVLDDNRPEGKDSRTTGSIKSEEIIGRVFFLFRKRGI